MSTYNIGLKPYTSRLNRQNPLTQGLVFDLPLFEGGGSSPMDLISLKQASITQTISWKKDLMGNVMNSASADGNQNLTVSAANAAKALTLCTLEVLINITAWSALNDDRIVEKGDTPTYYWDLKAQGNLTGSIKGTMNWATTENAWSISGVTANTWNHIVFIPNFATITAQPTFYLNGVNTTPTSLQAGSGAAVTDTNNITLFNKQGATQGRSVNGSIAYVRYWNRVLSASEVKLLYANPFRIYQKPKLWTPGYSNMPIIS